MIYILQSFFIFILNPIGRITVRIPVGIRNNCIRVICMTFPIFFVLRDTVILKSCFPTETSRHFLGSILIILLIIFSIDRPVQRIKWRPVLFYPLFLIGVGIIIVSFLHTVGSGCRLFALMIMFLYPCLYLIWNNRRDYDFLFSSLSYAFCIVSSFMFFFCLFQTVFGFEGNFMDGRYSGPFGHPNLLCILGMTGFCCALYLVFRKDNGLLIHIFLSLSIATGIGMVIMGQSRVSMAVCLATSFVSILFYVFHCRKSSLKVIMAKTAVIVALVIIALFISQINVDKQYELVFSPQEATVSTNEAGGSNENNIIDRITIDDATDANSYSSGRLAIWKNMSKTINLTGNDYNSTDWDKLTNGLNSFAHNNFFETTYRFGIIVGILFMIVEALAGVISLVYLFRKKENSYYMLFSIIFMVVYLFESMLDIATMSFQRIAPFMFYFVIIPMIAKHDAGH